jgi:acetamidase/formamidase
MYLRLKRWRGLAVASTLAVLTTVVVVTVHLAGAAIRVDYHLPSSHSTVYRGFFPRNAPPALTVPSGSVVRIDTVSHQGLNTLSSGSDPVTFNAPFGVAESEILPDAIDIYYNLDYPVRAPLGGGHVLTGPIYVEGAEPGDTLEARILKVEARVPWGYNTQSSGGALPGYLAASTRKLLRISGNLAHFADGIEIPLKPFQGIMAVAPADDFISPIESAAAAGLVSSRPPGPFGGNMDLNDLGEGTSLFLPVFQPGAQFYTGDPHEVQGNGEVSGTALEQSNTVTIQFIVHKGGDLAGPRAETPTHYILMGIDVDHDEAMRKALRDALDFLVAEKDLSPADAMSFASLAVDLNIAESVDFTNLVMARIPKRFFVKEHKSPPHFWHHRALTVRNEAQRQGLRPIPPGSGFSPPN